MNIIPENESKAFDIEAFAKDGKHVPIDPGAVYKFRIDKKIHFTEKRFCILLLVFIMALVNKK